MPLVRQGARALLASWASPAAGAATTFQQTYFGAAEKNRVFGNYSVNEERGAPRPGAEGPSSDERARRCAEGAGARAAGPGPANAAPGRGA
jgi:hypothetical protein